MQFYMGENIAVFSEKKAKTAIHPAMPEISTLISHAKQPLIVGMFVVHPS